MKFENELFSVMLPEQPVPKRSGRRKKADKAINIIFTRKSIGAVQMSNDLTLLERKIMNILIRNAQEIERNQDGIKKIEEEGNILYTIDFLTIETLLNIDKYHQRKDLALSLEKLVETSLKFNILKKDNTNHNWNIKTSLLAEVRYKDKDNDKLLEKIYYQFSATIRETLINPKIYTPLTLNIQNHFHSRHTLALWEYFSSELDIHSTDSYKTKPIPINDYVYLVAGSNVDYSQFREINRTLIKKPLEEINAKSDLTAEAVHHKTGRKVTAISHHIKRKDAFTTPLFDVNLNPCLKEAMEHNDCKNLQDLEIDSYKNLKSDMDMGNIEESKKNAIPLKPNLNSKEKQTLNELLIKSNISQKKREEFLEKYSPLHITENIEEAKRYSEIRKTEISAPLIIKAIEENWANSGPEKEKLKEKEKLLFDLKDLMYSYTGVNKKAEVQYIQKYIGDSILCLKKAQQLTTDEYNNSYSLDEVRKNFKDLNEFIDAVKYHLRVDLEKIDNLLLTLKDKHDLTLSDICQDWHTTKEELFKNMMVSEEEFCVLNSSL